MLRWLHRLVTAALILATAAGSLATLRQSPFAAPLVARSEAEAKRALDRAMARTVHPDWIGPRMDDALLREDLDQANLMAELAGDHAIALLPRQSEALAALRERQGGWLQTARDCGSCALNILACPTLSQLAVCALPVEMTPVGDANALRRNGLAALAGKPTDRLEVGLALVGLVATGAAIPSGGTTVPVKAGATMLRIAQRLGTLSAGFSRSLRDAVADLPINWAALRRGAFDQVTDRARLARLGAVAGDLGRIADRTSPSEALLLLRHVENADDAARLARLTGVAGTDSRKVLEVLGKSRAFRALVRLSDLALTTLALLYFFALQLALLLAGQFGRIALRALRPAQRP
ncbi:hypothetical protein [Szabonella alba]|uniref:Uncharacterized protein n=1 Tax=Szabonella alba TaxID=2804194 RepID=A0A8K0VFZ3_9RHOB|nr:hypothetical protein [Szabonella alba]MBL4918944.1 hypothetical protein [Szabonella alba]